MSFDLLAPHYRWLERILAGDKLQRCRTAFLHDIPPPRAVLLIGEGNGRCLEALLRVWPTAQFTCVDASVRMLECARARLSAQGLDLAAVRFIHADVLEWTPPSGHFDLVVTNFFLDCFRADQLAALVPRLAQSAKPDAHWLLADFCEPPAGLAKWRARLILQAMYIFFRVVTRLPATRLTPPDSFLRQGGFGLRQRRMFEWGLLHSDLWERLDGE